MTGEVLANGRIELLHYVREQSVIGNDCTATGTSSTRPEEAR